jgi:hypothetical protein
MRRRLAISLLGLATAAGLALAPAAAQASPAAHAPAARGAATQIIRPGASRAITLSPAACRAIRRSEHRPDASCAAQVKFTLKKVAHPDASTYWEGYGTVCGGTFGAACSGWWVDLHFDFTTSGSQAWENGFSSKSCTEGGTNITWCSYTGNGTDLLSMGANFGNGGWVRFDVEDGTPAGPSFVSWANSGTWCAGVGDACYS